MSKSINYRKRIKHAIIKAILHFFAVILYRPKFIGKENIPEKGAYIICANHVNNLDASLLILCVKRDVIFIAKEELFRNKFFRWLVEPFDIISVKRGTADIESMKASLKALKEEKLLGIFPEGTRNGMKKGVKLHNGAVVMALKANVKIIPIGISGDFKPFHRVIYNIGKPIDLSEYKERRNEKALLEKLTQDVMNEIVNLTKRSL